MVSALACVSRTSRSHLGPESCLSYLQFLSDGIVVFLSENQAFMFYRCKVSFWLLKVTKTKSLLVNILLTM